MLLTLAVGSRTTTTITLWIDSNCSLPKDNVLVNHKIISQKITRVAGDCIQTKV